VNTKTPIVTVLMPVYNGAKYLSEAIDSILNQTFEDFEFLIIDDGSTDDSLEFIKSYDDHRMRLVVNDKNIGQTATLNKGLELAVGKYIARMDQDDISLPFRLEKQIKFMEENSEIGISGTSLQTIGFNTNEIYSYAAEHSDIILNLFFHEPFIGHPTVIMNRHCIIENELFYDERYVHVSDYELWSRALHFVKLANINEVLLYYRINPNQATQKHRNYNLRYESKVIINQLINLDIIASNHYQNLHLKLVNNDYKDLRLTELLDILVWIIKLLQKNIAKGVYDNKKFSMILIIRLFCIIKYKIFNFRRTLFSTIRTFKVIIV